MTVWISERLALAIHDEQIAEHGGRTGVRDPGLLASALARPRNAASYGEGSVASLGAAYAIAITRNHPFVDGNKRTGFVAMAVFFELNGAAFEPPDAEAVRSMFALAAGEVDDAAFTRWVARHVRVND